MSAQTPTTARPARRRYIVGDRVSYANPWSGQTRFGRVTSAPIDGRMVGIRFDGDTYGQDWHGTASIKLVEAAPA